MSQRKNAMYTNYLGCNYGFLIELDDGTMLTAEISGLQGPAKVERAKPVPFAFLAPLPCDRVGPNEIELTNETWGKSSTLHHSLLMVQLQCPEMKIFLSNHYY